MQEFYEVFDTALIALSLEALRAPFVEHVQSRSTPDKTGGLLVDAGFRVVRTVEDSFCLRFLDGSAFLRHHFIRLAFLPAWRDLIPAQSRQEFFTALEARLNDLAKHQGHLRLTIPMGYVEAERESEQPDQTRLR